MNRRHFLATTAAVLSLAPGAALAEYGTAYSPGLVDRELAAGKTVFVGFSADWCTTCKAQERQLDALMAENPGYERAITFIRVDWDDFRGDELTQRLNIPRRSTLVVLKGDAELGRIVAGTSKSDIKGLLDIALRAAGA